ncbi:MAG: hypothetical protein K0Q59_1968 [Paenibacillus sp.]|nr:hypothetical protein [Paenibacillus sp.]
MIGFIVCFCIAFGGALFALIRLKKTWIEIGAFVTLSLIGFTVWLSIFLQHKINPNAWIGSLIDSIG